ncbi:membrane protein insertase YidC [candidate division KSB1 bacterium]|nr:membrane protein insertase YidC [candidate division KSB1 bacterium]NIR72468.1 membrane protein insertase YidC [candidate division KSB1 bacterium]NIS24053.1 membrane protein insertase YidC [candidate division KSB1 bacterium]NIT70972.1 membrane protein insertase YidC [candidate division KSB1 bacterium]NIU27383.1 membrane protein insertase YidC [candidate division KSB1 bacterium]
MEFDKKTILAFLLIGFVLILLQTEFYQKHFLPQPTKETAPVEETGTATRETEAPSREEPGRSERDEERLTTEEEESSAKGTDGFNHLRGDGEEVIVETDLYRAVLSTQGATVRKWLLKEYLMQDSSRVQLVAKNGRRNLGVLLPTATDTIDTSPYVFSVNKKKIVLNDRKATDKLEFSLKLDSERELKKIYTFRHNSYDVGFEIELRNLNDLVEGFSYLVTWSSGLKSTEPDFKADMDKAKAYAHQGEELEFSIGDEYEEEKMVNPTEWVAIRTKYFAVAVIPETAKGKDVTFWGTPVDVGENVPFKQYGFELSMPFVDQSFKEDRFNVFLGPLDYDIVQSYNVGLEKIMDLGWAIFRPFGKFVLWSFTLLHEVIPNYGFVIIVFSIIIKVALFPLTRKSYRSMKEMQTLQPLMQEINEKYKNDPQKKQQEVMKLYKEHGVNPLGGCIPMLLQMPLLIALFQVFQSTIQLRQASFIWWIQDLSRPDTIATLPFTIPLYGNTVNVLPLFMGVTMFIQQKMSMKDPKQKALVYFMPIFFTLIFNSFPSGLNLYYALFNLFTIFQEKLIPYKPKEPKPVKKRPVQKRRKHDYRGRF